MNRFPDGRIQLFSYIMDNLGTYTAFQYGPDLFISIQGNTVSICTSSWTTTHTTTIN